MRPSQLRADESYMDNPWTLGLLRGKTMAPRNLQGAVYYGLERWQERQDSNPRPAVLEFALEHPPTSTFGHALGCKQVPHLSTSAIGCFHPPVLLSELLSNDRAG